MDSINPKTLWIEPLFDVSEPYLYAAVLPPLVLFALGSYSIPAGVEHGAMIKAGTRVIDVFEEADRYAVKD